MDKKDWNGIKKNIYYFTKKLTLKKNRNPITFVLASVGILLAFLLIGTLAYLTIEDYRFDNHIKSYESIAYDAFAEKAKAGEIKNKQKISTSYIFAPPQQYSVYETNNEKKFRADFALQFKDDEELKPYVKKIKVLDVKENYGSIRRTIVGYIWFLVFISMIFILAMKIMSYMASGKNFSPKSINLNVTFEDIIGYEKVKQEFRDFKNFLKNKKKYQLANVTVPKGILLTGPPGVGKTMLAKALANELNCSFFTASGSDFAEMYVGVGPKRIRGLFEKANLMKPAVIFIDEIDALGSRNSQFTNSEIQGTINQLLVEMDGVSENNDVLVVAATNFPERIDNALLRPGRFDKKIHIALPDKETRFGMIENFLSKHEVAEDVDMEKLASQMSGSSGADIDNVIKEAKVIAFKKDPENPVITDSTIEQAIEDVALGSQTYQNANKDELKRIAYHELGHAVITSSLLPTNHLHKVSIVGRSMGLGYTLHTQSEEKRIHTKQDIEEQICVYLGGRAAEEIFMGNVSSGAYDDLQKCNQMAHRLVTKFGMSESLGLMVELDDEKNQMANNPYKQEKIVKEIKSLLTEQYEKTKAILEENKDAIEKLAILLLDNKEIHGDTVKQELSGK